MQGILTSTSITALTFFLPLVMAGILHPEESLNMFYMPVYLITIPSMSVTNNLEINTPHFKGIYCW